MLPVRSPRSRRFVVAAGVATLIALGATACGDLVEEPATGSGTSTTGPTSTSTALPTTTTPKAQADAEVDYRPLLLQAEHLSDDEDTFTARQVDQNPNGLPGASAFFVNQDDDRAISNTVVLYPDAVTASETLRAATETLDTKVVGGTPQPSPVGTDGVTISGTSVEGDKSITELLFTYDRALVRLEFESAVGDVTTDKFVTSVGKMQLIALQAGLKDTE